MISILIWRDQPLLTRGLIQTVTWSEAVAVLVFCGTNSSMLCQSQESTTYSTLVIGIYLPTADAPIDVFRSCLHTLEDLITNHCGPVILAGDFNCHVGTVGGPRGSRNSNLQGELLLEMVQNNDLFITSLSNMSSGPLYW